METLLLWDSRTGEGREGEGGGEGEGRGGEGREGGEGRGGEGRGGRGGRGGEGREGRGGEGRGKERQGERTAFSHTVHVVISAYHDTVRSLSVLMLLEYFTYVDT